MISMTAKELTRSETATPEPVQDGRRFIPQADIFESSNELTVLVDMPGVDPKDIDVRLEKGVLQISGKAPRRQDDRVQYLLQEYAVGDYVRSFDVGEGVDTQGITADHRDGVLALHLPKSEKLRPKRIEVRAK
jgi:HSP20 family molecular chaperone IbpA